MRQLVERGHIFIAQPPLYKVKKGKEELYLANDQELSAYLIRKATEERSVKVPALDRAISGTELYHLLEALTEYEQAMKGLERMGIDRDIVEAIFEFIEDKDDFATRDRLDLVADRIAERGHQVLSLEPDEEHGLFELIVRSGTRGRREIRVNLDLFHAVEMRQIRRVRPKIAPVAQPPLLVNQNGEETALETKEALLEHLMEAGKKGLAIQRYKGLGEMNPDQLWETTMDPERRQALEVTIEDAAEADMLFSILMGDAVEPRRRFIEENALDVQNLDI
jgi:DNA gyrase subunit B